MILQESLQHEPLKLLWKLLTQKLEKIMNNTLPTLIIDTDAGHDDALALMLLVKSREFNIEAITTVAGNSTIEKVTRNAQAVLDLLQTNIPLYSGAEAPLERNLITAVVHGDSGLDGLEMSSTQYNLTKDAVLRMKEILENMPHQVTILTLGPLTNIAQLFREYPHVIPLTKEVVIMGGAINVAGNKNRVAEFNIFVDPEAADVVFRADVKKVLVPLDPCNDVVLGLDTFDSLKGSPLYQPLTSMMKHFIAGIEVEEGVNGALVYDALAAYYLLNQEAFTLQGMDIVIETKGEHTSGMTVAERRLAKQKIVNTDVATSIDKDAFVTDLIKFLNKDPK